MFTFEFSREINPAKTGPKTGPNYVKSRKADVPLRQITEERRRGKELGVV
jgi:hypothetical protein